MPHTLVLSCLHALPVGLPDLGAAQKQSVASKQAAHLWASMRRCSTRGFSRFTTPLAHMLVLSCLYALPVRVPSATGHAKTECGEQAGGALVGVDEALQDARLQPLHGLAPAGRAVAARPGAVVPVRVVGGHRRLRLQPGAVLPGIYWHQDVVHRFRHSLLALQALCTHHASAAWHLISLPETWQALSFCHGQLLRLMAPRHSPGLPAPPAFHSQRP